MTPYTPEELSEVIEAARNLITTIDAHEIASMSCDRDGEEYCECLEESVQRLKAAISEANQEEAIDERV